MKSAFRTDRKDASSSAEQGSGPTMVNLRTMPDVITRVSDFQSDAGTERDEGVASGVEVLVLELTDLYDVYGRHMARVNKSIGERGEPELPV